MALPTTLLKLIADDSSHGTTSFLMSSPEAWANAHMLERYRIPKMPEDPPHHFASLCYEKLKAEYIAIRSWFQDDGSFSPLLQSRFMDQAKSGPIGDGIGWDYDAGGVLDARMLQFKCTMLAAVRTLDSLAARDLRSDQSSVGIAMRLAQSAYTDRAAIHRWRPIEEEVDGKMVVKFTGAELSRRWVTFRTYSLLSGYGVPHSWAWNATKARQVFGPTDEERPAY